MNKRCRQTTKRMAEWGAGGGAVGATCPRQSRMGIKRQRPVWALLYQYASVHPHCRLCWHDRICLSPSPHRSRRPHMCTHYSREHRLSSTPQLPLLHITSTAGMRTGGQTRVPKKAEQTLCAMQRDRGHARKGDRDRQHTWVHGGGGR